MLFNFKMSNLIVSSQKVLEMKRKHQNFTVVSYTLLCLSVFSTFAASQAFSQCANSSNVYSFTHNNKNYEVIKEAKTWKDACNCAVQRGGQLVEINDSSEQNAIYNAIINGAGVSKNYTTINNGGGIAYVWIGASDESIEGTWIWDGNNDSIGANFWTGQGANGTGIGSPVSGAYNNWGGKSAGKIEEPDNFGTGQHHGALALEGWPSGTTLLGVAGEWNDISGSNALYYVIEKNISTNTDDPVIAKKNISGSVFHLNQYTLFISALFTKVELFDINGRMIKDLSNLSEADLSGLCKGIYIIRAVDKSTIITEKFFLN